MPNYVENFIQFICSKERFAEIAKTIKQEGSFMGSVDFNKIIPLPTESLNGSDLQNTGLNSTEWRAKYWGTKWNACQCEEVDEEARFLQFFTAWDPVRPVVKVLSERFPDVPISYSWADEIVGSGVGSMVLLNGETLEEHMPPDYSKAAFELSAEVLDIDLAEWGFVFDAKKGTYENVGKNQYVEELPFEL